jgi:hypothetical protein
VTNHRVTVPQSCIAAVAVRPLDSGAEAAGWSATGCTTGEVDTSDGHIEPTPPVPTPTAAARVAAPSYRLRGLQRLIPHGWAHVAAWLDRLDARSVCALRATCRLGLLGFDIAVHAGWIALSVHDSDTPDEEGATFRW